MSEQTLVEKLIQDAAACVPTNWCDSLLTGPEGIGLPPYDCPKIERLLRGVQERIKALSTRAAAEAAAKEGATK